MLLMLILVSLMLLLFTALHDQLTTFFTQDEATAQVLDPCFWIIAFIFFFEGFMMM